MCGNNAKRSKWNWKHQQFFDEGNRIVVSFMRDNSTDIHTQMQYNLSQSESIDSITTTHTHICTHSYTQQQSKYNRIIETKPATKWSIGLVCYFAILLLLYLYLNFTSFTCEGNVAFHIWRTTYFRPSVYAFFCVHVNVFSMLELRLTLVLGGEGACVRDSG